MYLFKNRRLVLFWLIAVSSFGKITQAAELASFLQNDDATIYEPGGDVTVPKLLHYVEPEFSPSSKEAYVEGTVKISTVVTAEGKPRNSKVVSGLIAEEDRTALEALKHWTFRPGTKSGKPVNVRMTVQIDFHLL